MKRNNKGYVDEDFMLKFAVTLVLIIFILVCIFLCIADTKESETRNEWCSSIENYDYLIYDKETRIIYYKYEDGEGRRGYGYMTPYYSSNGKLCKYIDNKIIEIKE